MPHKQRYGEVDTTPFGLTKAQEVRRFHQSFPEYSVTPLVELKSLAEELGVSNIFVKDESYRFGLNAFKVLGGSYAIAREIGIRMAIGAKSWDIRLQFLVEALVLSLTGGLLGIALGISVAVGIKTFAPDFLPVRITAFPMVISFIFSGLVGICFGFFPAYKASTLNPIDALRFE